MFACTVPTIFADAAFKAPLEVSVPAIAVVVYTAGASIYEFALTPRARTFEETVSVLPIPTAPVSTEMFATFRPTPAPRTLRFATLALPATLRPVTSACVFVASI